MKVVGVFPKITKDYILKRVSQEDIMAFYLKIPVIDDNFIGNAFCNPFRSDESPTCNYYLDDNNKLRVRDFGGNLMDRLYNMDIFDVVGHIFNIDTGHKEGFKIVLKIIARDFKIHKYKDSKEVEILNTFLSTQSDYKKKIRIIRVVPRAWERIDEAYWYKRYGISYNTLKAHRVYPVQEVHLENHKGVIHRTYLHNKNNPAYAYYGGKEEEIHIWKIYFPLNTNPKFSKVITNKQFSQGFDTFLPTRIGVITKSYKDVMTLKEFGVQSVCVSSETSLLSGDEIFNLKVNSDIVVSLLDYDRQGITLANKLKKQYNIQPLMLTRGRYGKPDYGVKDISDFRERYGQEVTLRLIHKSIDYLEDRLEDVSKNRIEFINKFKIL